MSIFFTEFKVPIVLSVLILIIGLLAYFSLGVGEIGMSQPYNPEIYKDITFKAAYTKDGELKVFALAKNNALAKYKASEGDSIPESNTIVIGNTEAEMMRKEKLFSKPGDVIKGFFGINPRVGGVLAKTESPLDDFHFVSDLQFRNIEGEENRIFVRLNPENVPKLFYTYRDRDNITIKLKLKEGNMKDYIVHEIAGKKYYPVILGAQEAEMMRKEKLFSKPGDIIKGFFGKNIIIVGILDKTNTALDMMHLLPLSASNL